MHRAHSQIPRVYFKLGRLVGGQEDKLGLLYLLFALFIHFCDELLDLVNCLDAVEARHLEVSQNETDRDASLCKFRELDYCFLAIVNKLAKVKHVQLFEFLLDDHHVVQLVLCYYDSAGGLFRCKVYTDFLLAFQQTIWNGANF